MESISFFENLDFNPYKTRNVLLLVLFSIVSWILLSVIKSRNSKRPPGPRGLPIVGYIPFLGKEAHKTLWKLSKKYGNVMGLHLGTTYTVVLSDYEVVKEVLSHPAALGRSTKFFDYIPNFGFGTKNGEEWTEQRRFCRTATKDIGLGVSVWEDLVMEEVSSFLEKFHNAKGRPVDISKSLVASIISNILSILIGRRLKEADDGDKIKCAVKYADVALNGVSLAATIIPGVRKFCEIFRIAGYHETHQTIHEFAKFIREEVIRHKTNKTFENVDDLINMYLDKMSDLQKSGNEKHYFSEEMLEGNVNLLFLGGSDTIASSLGWLIRLMAKYKNIQEKVYTELMEVVGRDGRARYRERQNIPYTFAVLMESQRFSSVVPLSTFRRSNADIPIKDIIIPKGTEITSNLWALHHDPKYWENPEEFRPERFLTDNGKKLIAQPPSFLPFSIGKRNCPGEAVAWMEILFYFTEILKNFEISTPPGIEPEFKIVNGLVAHLEPQPLCFKERK